MKVKLDGPLPTALNNLDMPGIIESCIFKELRRCGSCAAAHMNLRWHYNRHPNKVSIGNPGLNRTVLMSFVLYAIRFRRRKA
jgi:hypothetical protein